MKRIFRSSGSRHAPSFRFASILFACLGVGALGWVLFGKEAGRGQPNAAPAPASPKNDASTPAPPKMLLQARADKPSSRGGPNPAASANSASHGTAAQNIRGASSDPGASTAGLNEPLPARGPHSIVRWRLPTAAGLALLEAGQAQEALAWARNARPRMARRGKLAQAQNMLLQARALLALERFREAAVIFSAQAKAPPGPEAAADAAFGQALCQARGAVDRIPAAELGNILAQCRTSWGGGRAAFEQARRTEQAKFPQEKREEAARALYQRALFSERLEAPIEKECLERLKALTERIVLDPRRRCARPKAVFHTVAPGESLYKIARAYHVPSGQIVRVNRLNPKSFLQVRQVLKILPGRVTVRVDRWRLTATLLLDGVFIRRYPIGIGPRDHTPEGTFSIRSKLKNPTWYYGGRRIPFGHPENILGTRWLGFDREELGGRGAGIGLHGTTIPESVPGRESKGCIRMHNQDVEELYDFVPPGAKVTINP